MRANPNPFYRIAHNLPDGTIMIANTNGKPVFGGLQLLEVQRWMPMVLLPQFIVLPR
jgi:hypothetical protein